MQIVKTSRIEWKPRSSPSGKFARAGCKISEALGHDPRTSNSSASHPFDVEITKVPPKAASCPYHSHSAQWEFYHVVSGHGTVRHAGGTTGIEAGDAFIFKPGEAHQLINDGSEDLVYYVIADNPVGESCFYPDSNKWAVKSPEYRIMRSEPLDYFEGEDEPEPGP
ncbi:MAG TPA: cupin domain-containing protein [Candidatus Tumulicola sp.]|jgi:uncharacterized cupin superfamily protein